MIFVSQAPHCTVCLFVCYMFGTPESPMPLNPGQGSDSPGTIAATRSMIDWVIHWGILHFRIYECLDIFQGSSIDLPTLLNSFGPFVALSDRLVPCLVGDSAASAILVIVLVDRAARSRCRGEVWIFLSTSYLMLLVEGSLGFPRSGIERVRHTRSYPWSRNMNPLSPDTG